MGRGLLGSFSLSPHGLFGYFFTREVSVVTRSRAALLFSVLHPHTDYSDNTYPFSRQAPGPWGPLAEGGGGKIFEKIETHKKKVRIIRIVRV